MSEDRSFEVELRRSGQTLDIPSDRTALEVIEEVLGDIPWGCRQGQCGACATDVIEGEVDHRDEVLSEEEQKSGCGIMMICVSRAKGDRLVLDL